VTADDAVLRSLAEAIGEGYRRIREDERAFVEGLSEDEIRQRLEKLVVTIRRAKKPASESKSGERLKTEELIIGAIALSHKYKRSFKIM